MSVNSHTNQSAHSDATPTTILHVSDTHLGYRQYRSDLRRTDFLAAFSQALDLAIERDVDAVLHTGDLFDMRNPPNTVLLACISALSELSANDIPFYGIVGNHERKQDVQHLDLIHEADVATRLDDEPTVINGDVALYGIDSVPQPSWDSREFDLAEPPGDCFTILTMHELLTPPLPKIEADHELSDVLDCLEIDLDAIALGDDHTPRSDRVDGVEVWYPGSTERTARDQQEQRSVQLLEIEDSNLTRTQLPLDTRSFHDIQVRFDEEDMLEHVAGVLDRHNFTEAVVEITLTGEPTATSSRDVRKVALDKGAAVCQVEDRRGGPELDSTERLTANAESIDRRIESRIEKLHVSSVATEIESNLRMGSPASTGLADDLQEDIENAMNAAHDDILTTERDDK